MENNNNVFHALSREVKMSCEDHNSVDNRSRCYGQKSQKILSGLWNIILVLTIKFEILSGETKRSCQDYKK
jgi:hypothetical protein